MKTKYRILLIALSVITLGLIFCYFIVREKGHVLKKYYPESKETFTVEYVIRDGDTVLQGKSFRYNEKGNKISECNFVNNIIKGKHIYYYENGNVESVEYITDNKTKAEILWNYPDGEIKKYVFFNDIGQPYFIISYDEKGPKKYEGPTIKNIYFGKLSFRKKPKILDEQYYKVGDTLYHQYLVANIPNAKRVFKIENIGIDNKKVKRKIISRPPTSIYVQEILTKKGKNTIRAFVGYEFKDKVVPAINDTLSFDIEVH